MKKPDNRDAILIEGQEQWKIHPPYEVFYIECIKTACLNVINSWETINEIVSDESLLKSNAIDTVDLAENIINQVGIISKYFFPSRNQGQKNLAHKYRGEKLRDAFKIDDTNILKNRAFRDFIEHFDEKLDLFLNKSVAGNIIPPKSVYWTSKEINEVTIIFKAFVISEFRFISMGEKILLPTLVKEIYNVYNQCIEFLNNGGRLR